LSEDGIAKPHFRFLVLGESYVDMERYLKKKYHRNKSLNDGNALSAVEDPQKNPYEIVLKFGSR